MTPRSPRVVLAAFTHFGARGLKGTEMYHLVKDIWRLGYLRRAIVVSMKRCGYDFNRDLVVTFPGESRLFSFLSHLKERIRGFPSRWLGELAFDCYAASRLTEPGDILLTTPGAVRTACKARSLGYRVVLYGATPDPRYLGEQIRLERLALGLRNGAESVNRSQTMARALKSVMLADRIIALSEFSRDTYVAYGFPADRISVAPLGIALDRFPTYPPPWAKRLTYLFVGHVAQTTGMVKGLAYLLRAWCDLDLNDARLVLCGKLGPEAHEMVKVYAGRLKHVEFAGAVSEPGPYYRAASVFVLPSIAEGFAKVVLEAMATGRAVIVTQTCAGVVRDGVEGLVVPARDVTALADAMLTFYRRRELVEAMGQRAADRAQTFTWQRFSTQVAEIVEESFRGYALRAAE